MRCEEIMEREVKTVGPDENVRVAARKMRDADVGFLPVCDEHGLVVGVVTDRDITIRHVAEEPFERTVRDVMTENVISCSPAEDIERAEDLMEQHKVSRVVCVDERGRPAGVISLQDLSQALDEEATGEIVHELKEEGPGATVH